MSECHEFHLTIIRFSWSSLACMCIKVVLYLISVHVLVLCIIFKSYLAKLIEVEVVSPYRNPQPQVVENYSYLFNLSTNICKS